MNSSFENNTVKLTTTTITDVYQAPDASDAERALVLSCLVANIDGTSAAEITMSISNSANTELSKIANTIPVPADASLELLPNKLVLRRGQKLRATASQANMLDVTVSVLEIS